MANSADPDQLASQKPTDLDLHCLQKQGISGFSRTRVNKTLLEKVMNAGQALILWLTAMLGCRYFVSNYFEIYSYKTVTVIIYDPDTSANTIWPSPSRPETVTWSCYGVPTFLLQCADTTSSAMLYVIMTAHIPTYCIFFKIFGQKLITIHVIKFESTLLPEELD